MTKEVLEEVIQKVCLKTKNALNRVMWRDGVLRIAVRMGESGQLHKEKNNVQKPAISRSARLLTCFGR